MIWGKLLALYYPPSTFDTNAHSALLTGHHTSLCPLSLSPDGDRTHPSWQSGPGCCHLPSQHPPPSGTPFTIPLGSSVPPSPSWPRSSLRLGTAYNSTRPSPRPLPSCPPDHHGRRRLYPFHSMCHRLRHRCHYNPT